MNRAQQRFGEPSGIVLKKVAPFLDAMVQDFIRQAPFAVLATADAEGNCDASPKGGRPGFVKVLDEKRLLVPDIAGNKLFHSYSNLESNPKAALVFLIPGCDWTVRVSGRVSVVVPGDRDLAGLSPEVLASDDNTRVLQALLLDVVEAYAHCPRAFTFSGLWDPERIAETRAGDPNRYWYARFREAIAERG
jgi:predicted pyridoxine 5'-phosphate oxidase superfamily flavin-nucleotide-binding protein